MDLEKVYYDQDGNECNILAVVKRSPEWAANRIQEGEKAINRIQKLKDHINSFQYENDLMTIFQIRKVIGQ